MATFHLKNWQDARGNELKRAKEILANPQTNIANLARITKLNEQVLRNYKSKPDRLDHSNWKTINRLAQAQDIATVQDTMTSEDTIQMANLLTTFFHDIEKNYADDPAMVGLLKRMGEIVMSDPLAVCELFKSYIKVDKK